MLARRLLLAAIVVACREECRSPDHCAMPAQGPPRPRYRPTPLSPRRGATRLSVCTLYLARSINTVAHGLRVTLGTSRRGVLFSCAPKRNAWQAPECSPLTLRLSCLAGQGSSAWRLIDILVFRLRCATIGRRVKPCFAFSFVPDSCFRALQAEKTVRLNGMESAMRSWFCYESLDR